MIPDNGYKVNMGMNDAPMPPVMERTGNRVVLKYPITIHECLYLNWHRGAIAMNLELKFTLIFLGASQEMQELFNKHLATNLKDCQFTAQEIDLNTIIPSIIKKTRTFVLSALELSGNVRALEMERENVSVAVQASVRFNQSGAPGSACTVPEAKHILRYLSEVEKKLPPLTKK